MAYLSQSELEKLGFKHLGKNVRISDKASIYNAEQMEIRDYARIDDFCVISGKVSIGRYVHIAPHCLVAGGEKGVGAMTLVNKSTEPWGIYVGNPATRIKDRRQDLLALEQQFLAEYKNDSI